MTNLRTVWVEEIQYLGGLDGVQSACFSTIYRSKCSAPSSLILRPFGTNYTPSILFVTSPLFKYQCRGWRESDSYTCGSWGVKRGQTTNHIFSAASHSWEHTPADILDCTQAHSLPGVNALWFRWLMEFPEGQIRWLFVAAVKQLPLARLAVQLTAEVWFADSTFGVPGAKLGQSWPPPGAVLLLNAVFCPIWGMLESPFNI